MCLKPQFVIVAVSISLLGCCARLHAQSLGDIAKKEEERRKTVKHPSKVYTNDDIRPAPAASSPAADKPGTQATAGDKPADKDQKSDTKTDAKAAEKDKKSDDSKKDQAYWSAHRKELITQIDRDQTYADALQTRINALTADFSSRSDPVQRSAIERDRLKAIGELDQLQKNIQASKKALADFEEEARRAGVPPGWLR